MNRQTIPPWMATGFVSTATICSFALAFISFVHLSRHQPGLDRLALLDVAVFLAVALGLAFRRSPAAWAGLIYCVLIAIAKLMTHTSNDIGDAVLQVIIYALAV